MNARVDVALGARSYAIEIGRGLLSGADPQACSKLDAVIGGRQVLIVTDANVAAHWLEGLNSALHHRQPLHLILEAGESHKTLASAERIWQRLVEMKANRDVTLIAFGGGVIGDLVGFAASCWMRGAPFIQIPTTLLAQVDSSVGGKTGVNLPQGKNLVGAFHQPKHVLIDVDVLRTLPARELRAGLAEVVKYGAIVDAEFFTWLEQHVDDLLNLQLQSMQYAIEKSCAHKAAIVMRDEFENGDRAWLNYGHTFGHAIESATHYSQFLHGEAVAIGMVLAARLSVARGQLNETALFRLIQLLQKIGLPTELPTTLKANDLLDLMRLDKKNRSGVMRLILLRGLGQAEVVEAVDESAILAVLRQ